MHSASSAACAPCRGEIRHPRLSLARAPVRVPAQGECVLSVCWLSAMLTGVAFCGPTCDDVAVVAYDTDELHIYKAAP